MHKLLAIFAMCSFICAGDCYLKADDKQEDKANEVALAYLKAMKSKDVEKMLSLSQTPFLLAIDIVEKPEDLKAKVKAIIGSLKTDELTDRVLVFVDTALFLSFIPDEFGMTKWKADIRRVIGNNGGICTLKRKELEQGFLMVTIKDGKARIVGIDLADELFSKPTGIFGGSRGRQ